MNTPSSDTLTPRDWVRICLSLGCLIILTIICRPWWGALPTMPRQCIMTTLAAAAWGGFFALRRRRPVWADILTLVGVYCFNLIPLPALTYSWALVKGACALLFLIMPFIDRLRLMIAIPAWTSVQLPGLLIASVPLFMQEGTALDPAFGTALSIVILFAWWLVGMRWNLSHGKYRCYAWVGNAAYIMLLITLKNYTDMASSRPLPLYCGVTICAAPLLFPLLRPREGWGLLRVFYIVIWAFTGICALAAPPASALGLLTVFYGVLLAHIAIRQRSRRVLFYSIGAVGTAVYDGVLFTISSRIELPPTLTQLVALGCALALSFILYRRIATLASIPPPAEPPAASFPRSKKRSIWLASLICLQLAGMGGAILYHQHRLLTAPRIRVEGVWTAANPDEWQWNPHALQVQATHPLQDTPFFGKSLWWELPGASRPEPQEGVAGACRLGILTPVSAFLREGDDGLWRITRVEAPRSSEDAAQEGELCLPALMSMEGHAPYSVTCSLNLGMETLRKLQEHLDPHYEYNLHEVSITIELIVPKGGSPEIAEIYIDGAPLSEAVTNDSSTPDHGTEQS